MSNSNQEFEEVKAEIQRIIQKGEHLVKELGKSISQEAGKLFGNMTGEVDDRMSSVIHGAKEGGKKVNQFARENPWLLAGLALTIGFLAGILMKDKKI